MDVACIANKKSAAHPEFVGNAMMDTIGSEPIYVRHFDIKKRLDLSADVFKAEVFAMRQLGRHKADQPLHSTRPYREHQREDMFTKVDVQVARKAARDLNVRDIEELLIGAPPGNRAGEFRAHSCGRHHSRRGMRFPPLQRGLYFARWWL